MSTTDAGADNAPASPSTATLFAAVVPPLFIGMIDQTIVATALPDIARDLGGFGTVGMLITAYLAATAISAPVYGRLGDALGRRKLMSIAIVVTMLGSLLCAIAPNFGTLVAARVMQGFGGGGLISLAQALLGQYVGPRRRARYQGYLAGIAIVASTFGPVVGGFVTGHLGWRWIFALNVPLTLLALLLIQRLPPRRTPKHAMVFDWAGLALFAALTVLIIAGFDSLKTGTAAPALLACAVIVLGLLVWRERRATHPLFPGDLLANRSISLSALLAMCHGALYVALLSFIPIYFAVARDRAADEIGLLMLPITVGIGTGAFVTGRLMSRSGRTTLYPVTGLICAAGLLLFLSRNLSELPDLGISLVFMLVSACLGSIMGVVQITVQMEAGVPRLGIATSSVSLSRSFGAVAGTAVAGVIVGAGLAGAAPDPDRVFGTIFLGGAGFALLASGVAAAIPRRQL
ncbi:MFS transporter [Salipiger abyssi]|uniref:Major Facilitator Superfamily transporter n=1 Tax=Salipiger abyssi TaxID=1250539 RepID=A0A1P8ULY2_9RHOB|nr:MFS transporter [Salipiger abyssi]APZ50375.1 Major Facilitator Superfamily transporter [Salipiger abyssi]